MADGSAFAAQKDFWQEYIRYRPVYPQELYDIVFEHHRKYSKATNPWAMAHDVGAGVGIASLDLSNQFDRVIVSDPSDANIQAAEDHLLSKTPGGRFSFFTSSAEDAPNHIEDQSVDLVVSAEAIMWADHDKAMSSVTRMMHIGGTLAFWSYHCRPYILGGKLEYRDLQEKLHAVYERFIDIFPDFVDMPFHISIS